MMDLKEEAVDEEGGLDLTYWLVGLMRFGWLILLTTGCGVLISAMQAATLSEEYASEGALYVRPGVARSLTPESAFTNDSGSRMSSRDWVMNELEVLKSPLLYKKAVRIAGADTVLDRPDDQVPSDSIKGRLRVLSSYVNEWLVPSGEKVEDASATEGKEQYASWLLASRSGIFAKPRTTVISVTTTAESAAKAKLLTDALLEAAVELHSEVVESMGSLVQVEKELAATEKMAAGAERVLDEFCAKNAIYDFELQKSSLTADLLEQERALFDTSTTLLRTEAERALLEGLAKSTGPTRQAPGTGTLVLNPQRAVLESTLEQLRLRRFDLAAENARMSISGAELRERMEAIDALERDARDRLAKEPKQLALKPAEQENPDYQTIQQDLRDRVVQAKGLTVLKRSQTDALAGSRKELQRLRDLEPRWRTLSAAAERQRFSYRRLLDSVSNMQAVRRLERQKLSNLQIMHQGTLNPLAVGPKRAKKVAIGLVGGFGVGLALALSFVFFSKRVNGVEGVRRAGVSGDKVFNEPRSVRSPAGWAVAAFPSELAPYGEAIKAYVAATEAGRAEGSRSVALTSSDSQADASRAAGLLAVGLSTLRGERVLFVSLVEDSSWLAKTLGLSSGTGWIDGMQENGVLQDAVLETGIARLDYLPAGGEAARIREQLSVESLRGLLAELGQQYAVVVIEAPSLSEDPTGQVIFRVVDGVQLVVKAKRARFDEVRYAVKSIADSGSELVACSLQQ